MTSSDDQTTEVDAFEKEDDMHDTKKAIQEYENRLKAVQEEAAKAEESLQVLLCEAEEEKQNLKSELAAAKDQLSALEQLKKSELEQSAIAKKAELKRLVIAHQSEVEELQKKNVCAISEWNKAEEQALALDQKVKTLESEKQQNRDQTANDLQNRKQSESLAAVNGKNAALEEELRIKNAKIAELEAKVVKLEHDVKLIEAEKKKVEATAKADKETAAKALADKSDECLVAQQDVRELIADHCKSTDPSWEEKCKALKKANVSLTEDVAAIKESLKKERIDLRNLASEKKRLETEMKAAQEANAKQIKELEKKISTEADTKKKKEQDAWESTDKQAEKLRTTMDQAREVIRQESAQRIKELEERLHYSENQQSLLKTNLQTAQRDLMTSKRKAKKMQQTTHVDSTEKVKVLVSPEPPMRTPAIVELLKKAGKMPGYYYPMGFVLFLTCIQLLFPSMMQIK